MLRHWADRDCAVSGSLSYLIYQSLILFAMQF